jgi:hypothetical protein
MNSTSGLTAVLTVSLIALVTMQVLKDKFQTVENYEDLPMDHVAHPASVNAQNVDESNEPVRVLNRDLSNAAPHGMQPFTPGVMFRQPYIAPDANRYNTYPDILKLQQLQTSEITPSARNLELIGSSTAGLPGPNQFMVDSFAPAGTNNSRASNLSLCSQNMPTAGVAPMAIASSLLPKNNTFNGQLEGFHDCAVNELANQVFLTPGGQIGYESSGTHRNANVSLRSEPPNPILNVGPWMNSTIGPDLLRRPLEDCAPSFGMYGNGPNSADVPSKIH